MNNALLTRMSNYGLTLLSNQIQTNTKRFILIGSSKYDDAELMAALDANDITNQLTYTDLNAKGWIGYEGVISQSYYDRDNFLTFEIRVPYEEELNIYVYGFGLVDTTGSIKQLIAISRSPSIFNKVKYSTSLFSIKLTFGQDEINDQLRDNVYNSVFQDAEYSFRASGEEDTDIITAVEIVRNINVGTRLSGEGIPDNTVVVGNNATDEDLSEHQLRISRNLTKTIDEKAIFIVKTIYKQEDFVTRAEFNNWQRHHNHNDMYYTVNETVQDSLKLNGLDHTNYVKIEEFNDMRKNIDSKISNEGGTLKGSLISSLNKTTAFRDDELVPLFHIKKLLKEIKTYIDEDFTFNIDNKLDSRVGNLNSLSTSNRGNLVFAINELRKTIGNLSQLETRKENVVNALNELYTTMGDPTTLQKYDNLVSAINDLEKTKISNTGSTFTTTPRVEEVIDIKDSNLDEHLIATIGTVKQFINTTKRRIMIDLTQESVGMTFPIVLNESGLNHFTDSIIWNENDSAAPGTFRVFIQGSGSYNRLNSAYLHVANSCTGHNKYLKRICTHTASSAIIVYLRGGYSYHMELRGSDQDPIIVTNSNGYILQGSTIAVKPESYSPYEYLDNGTWDFYEETNVLLDYKFNTYNNKNELSMIGQIVYFPTSNIQYPFLPMVGQMLSKETDSKLYRVIGDAGDPTGVYNTETHFKNLDGRDMIPVGVSQGSLIPAQILNVSCEYNTNVMISDNDLTGVGIGTYISASSFPQETRITRIEGNKIYVNKNSVSHMDNSIVTCMRVSGTYQNNLYFANANLPQEHKSIRAGLLSLYPAIRSQ